MLKICKNNKILWSIKFKYINFVEQLDRDLPFETKAKA
jgi:heme oxygenase